MATAEETATRSGFERVARGIGRGLVGLFLGLVAGLATTLAVIVARAHLENVFLHDLDALLGWMGLPLVLLPAAGLWLGLRGGDHFRGLLVWAVPGLFVGLGLGVVLGWVLGTAPSMPWAGGIVGSAAGMLGGAVAGWLHGQRRVNTGGGGAGSGGRAAVILLAVVGTASCGGEPEAPLPDAARESEPDSARVESVVYFLGDPGLGRVETHPVFTRVRREVEAWSARLDRDSAVAVVILGDVVYPQGLRSPDHPAYAEDSARIAAQAGLVAGPRARDRSALGVFLAGNHDWGQQGDWEGAVRLVRLDRFLDRWAEATGAAVDLYPPPGEGGPAVLDIGAHVRLVLLDTAWWLLESEARRRASVAEGVGRAIEAAGERHVVVAAHHPFVSAGPHGNLLTLGTTLGLRTLLARSGAMLQDLSSPPYRWLRRDLEEVFRRQGAPVLFAGGHEHSLQVIRGQGEASPRWHLVSGSASKRTEVGSAAGMVFGRSLPGFARLYVLRDGSLRLSVVAAPAEYMSCPEGTAGAACMEEGVAAYRTVWSGALED